MLRIDTAQITGLPTEAAARAIAEANADGEEDGTEYRVIPVMDGRAFGIAVFEKDGTFVFCL